MDWGRIVDILAGALLSTAFATVVIYRIERTRRPKIRIEIEEPLDHTGYPEGAPARKARYLVLNVINEPLKPCWRWLGRDVALKCTATVAFHRLDGQNVFGRSFACRWSASDEPGVAKLETVGLIGKEPIQLFRTPRISKEPEIDIYPGSREELAIAARFDEDTEAYGWSNANYLSNPAWRNPESKLPLGRYLTRVTIRCPNAQEAWALYRIINDVSVNAFRLERTKPSDRVRD